MVTNKQFLNHVFGSAEGERFICSFKGDPGSQRSYSRHPNEFPDPEANNFFCVSLLNKEEDGTVRRTPGNFRSLHVLVVDDVHSKIPRIQVESTLGVPSYKIETSPGNEQWGYVLEPAVIDRAEAEGLINALCRNFTSDVAGVNRLVRLPVGRNGKKIYGEEPLVTTLQYIDGTRLFNPKDLARALDARPEDYQATSDRPFLPVDRDPVLAALERRGDAYESTRDPGKYRVTCPWVGEHTGGRDDGSVYIAPSGYKCWHGHCANRTFSDFREHLGLSVDEIDQAIALAAFEAGMGVSSNETVQQVDAVPLHPTLRALLSKLPLGGWTRGLETT